MEITLPLISIFLIAVNSVAIFIALFIGGMLLLKNQNQQFSKYLLGLLVLLSALTLTNEMLMSSGLANRFQNLYFLPIYHTLSIGPLFYFFIRFKLSEKPNLTFKDSLHFLLPFIQVFTYLLIGFRSLSFKAYLWEKTAFPIYLDIESILFPISLTFYTLIAMQVLKKNQPKAYFWSEDLPAWLRKFAHGILLIAFIETFTLLLSEGLQLDHIGWVVFRSLVFTSFVIWVAFNAYQQYFVLNIYKSPPTVPTATANPPSEALLTRIKTLMETEKVYLNPDFNIQLLAQYLEKTEKVTSSCINKGLGYNFNTFVNTYRIEAFKDKIATGEAKQLTLMSIAYDCGFDSKSTFNRVFKQMVGCTPSQYVKNTPVSN